MSDGKKRVIKSLENLTEELRDLLKKQYPNGFETSISRIVNAKREPIFVFPLETEDSIILVKVPATKNSDGEYDVESNEEKDTGGSDDDNFDNSDDSYGNDSNESEDDYEESPRRNREASYDPDFDG